MPWSISSAIIVVMLATSIIASLISVCTAIASANVCLRRGISYTGILSGALAIVLIIFESGSDRLFFLLIPIISVLCSAASIAIIRMKEKKLSAQKAG